jgi:aspartyl-tRNA(Asn)/glutamyl-tRNA(Gln) amidotransferase subunit A
VVETKFKAQGGVLLGKLATHEFALGGPSFDLPFPPARNPWNREHIPGGSSSGSGAAVAAGLVRMAMGSDTGGSIRGPAAYCGTVGMKPTYGLVSRRGVFPLSTTLDHCGPLSWTGEDSAIALQIIAGYDRLDPASVDLPVPNFLDGLGQGVEGLRIGLPASLRRGARGFGRGRRSDRPSRGDARKARRGGRADHAAGLRAVQYVRPRHHVHRGLRHS